MVDNFYEIKGAKFLYKDQYGKSVFLLSETNDFLSELNEKIKKYNSLNPIVFDKKIIKFNDVKHIYVPREKYNLLYFINKTQNEKNKKIYINLHITDMEKLKQKLVPMISIENI